MPTHDKPKESRLMVSDYDDGEYESPTTQDIGQSALDTDL